MFPAGFETKSCQCTLYSIRWYLNRAYNTDYLCMKCNESVLRALGNELHEGWAEHLHCWWTDFAFYQGTLQRNEFLRWLITLVCSITHICWLCNTFWNDLWKFSERLVNPKEEMTKFEWPCAANFESYSAFSLIIVWRKNSSALRKCKITQSHNKILNFKLTIY